MKNCCVAVRNAVLVRDLNDENIFISEHLKVLYLDSYCTVGIWITMFALLRCSLFRSPTVSWVKMTLFTLWILRIQTNQRFSVLECKIILKKQTDRININVACHHFNHPSFWRYVSLCELKDKWADLLGILAFITFCHQLMGSLYYGLFDIKPLLAKIFWQIKKPG